SNQGSFAHGRIRARMKKVSDRAGPEIDGILAAERPGKIALEVKLVDIECQFKGVDLIRPAGYIIVIAVIACGEGGIQLVAERMFPFYRQVPVAIAVGGIAVQ